MTGTGSGKGHRYPVPRAVSASLAARPCTLRPEGRTWMAISTSRSPHAEDEPDDPASWEGADSGGAGRSVLEWVVVVAAAVLVALVIKTFIMQAFFIPSASMEPTLLVNDRVLVNKLSYRLHDVNRYDVVVFERSSVEGGDQVSDIIKRVIGLPGEQVFFEDEKVHINGQPLDEPYLPPGTVTNPAPKEMAFDDGRQCIRDEPCQVPANSVWLMGDNRTNSQDSRYIGPVPMDAVVGRAFVTIWPPGRVGGL
jgi:signal peptidase I